MEFSIRWDRTQKKVRITREQVDADPTVNPPFGAVYDKTMLRYADVTNALVPRAAVGLYNDLELHVEWPYVLAQDISWAYGTDHGTPSGDLPSSPTNEPIDVNGAACPGGPGSCPLFAVPSTIYRGGKMGDLKAGLAWGIFSERKDDTKPTWIVGVDITFPTAAQYDPAAGRVPDNGWLSPYTVPAKRGPVGEKAFRFDFSTALSKRMGPIDPYFRAHVTTVSRAAATYSNCDHVAQLASGSPPAMGQWAPAACAAAGDSAGARPPYVAGVTFGTEIVPVEDPREGQKLVIDLRLTADYTSSARWYNELTDATGKLHYTQSYVTVGGLFGLYLNASDVVSIRATARIETQTDHFLTGEGAGGPLVAGSTTTNPNYDPRDDAPGTRFRATEATIFTLSVMGVLRF